MTVNEAITLGRDCEAFQIPSGMSLILSAGTRVRLTQSLGGTYTVMTEAGLLARIAGKDADAIGQEIVPSQTGSAGVVTVSTFRYQEEPDGPRPDQDAAAR